LGAAPNEDVLIAAASTTGFAEIIPTINARKIPEIIIKLLLFRNARHHIASNYLRVIYYHIGM